jgi:hypothetical protein
MIRVCPERPNDVIRKRSCDKVMDGLNKVALTNVIEYNGRPGTSLDFTVDSLF